MSGHWFDPKLKPTIIGLLCIFFFPCYYRVVNSHATLTMYTCAKNFGPFSEIKRTLKSTKRSVSIKTNPTKAFTPTIAQADLFLKNMYKSSWLCDYLIHRQNMFEELGDWLIIHVTISHRWCLWFYICAPLHPQCALHEWNWKLSTSCNSLGWHTDIWTPENKKRHRFIASFQMPQFTVN